MPVMRHLNVGGTTYDTVGEASVTQVLSSGTKIATVSIDGTSTDLYAPAGGSSVDPATAAPSMDGTAAVGSSAKYAREDHVHPSDTSKQATLVSGTNIKTVNSESLLGSGNIAVQPTLVSGTNIKTVNNESLLGSGNITIQGGSGGSVSYYTVTAFIPTTGWEDNSITVSVMDMTADADVIVAPAITSAAEWLSCGIFCIDQGEGTLTFSRTDANAHTLTANLLVFSGGEHVEPPVTNKTVTVTLTNPVNASYFRGCTISELLSEDLYNGGEALGTISSATGSATVTVPSDINYISIYFDSSFPAADPGLATCTGSIVASDIYDSSTLMFNVLGDGTITIDGMNYYDD